MRKNILYYLSCAGAIVSSFLIFLLYHGKKGRAEKAVYLNIP